MSADAWNCSSASELLEHETEPMARFVNKLGAFTYNMDDRLLLDVAVVDPRCGLHQASDRHGARLEPARPQQCPLRGGDCMVGLRCALRGVEGRGRGRGSENEWSRSGATPC